MTHKNWFAGLASVAFLMVAGAVNAADLIVDAAGQLTGASNVSVNVGGTAQCYDVTFTANNPTVNTYPDGSCQDVFSGCDDAAQDFGFTIQADAKNAAQALLDQVLIDDSSSVPPIEFDTKPAMTRGCIDPTICTVLIPYGLLTLPPAGLDYELANNAVSEVNDVITNTAPRTTDAPYGSSDDETWAVFTPCQFTPTPEPSAVIYLLYGLAGLALVSVFGNRRHRQS